MNLTLLFILLGISFAILIFGIISGQKLETEKKNIYVRRFASAAMIPILLYLIITAPYVSSFSYTEIGFEKQNAENLETIEDLAKYEKFQTRNIDSLNEEILRLREDLDEMNNHYKLFSQIVVTGLLVFCFLAVFRGNKMFGKSADKE